MSYEEEDTCHMRRKRVRRFLCLLLHHESPFKSIIKALDHKSIVHRRAPT